MSKVANVSPVVLEFLANKATACRWAWQTGQLTSEEWNAGVDQRANVFQILYSRSASHGLPVDRPVLS